MEVSYTFFISATHTLFRALRVVHFLSLRVTSGVAISHWTVLAITQTLSSIAWNIEQHMD